MATNTLSPWGLTWGSTWDSTWGLTRIEEARSGYWRLFYYELQEKSLRERDNTPEVKISRFKARIKTTIKDVKKETYEIRPTNLPPQRKLPVLAQQEISPPPSLELWGLLRDLEFTLAPRHDKVIVPSVRKEAPNYLDESLLLLLAA